MKKKPKFNKEATIRGALRRAFSRSPLVREVLEESRQEFPRYKKDGTRHKRNWVKRQCQVCNEWVGSSHIAVDHKDPVISVEHGKQDWNTFIDRLWCETSGKANLQRICDACHDKKTHKEKIERLTKQYTEELDCLEMDIKDGVGDSKTIKKQLAKYIAKKKTPDLEQIVQRARDLKERLK